jgi:epoxide hydrolase 4
MELRHEYADLATGIRLHYGACGEGPLILFLHGFPEYWYQWKKILPAFQSSHLAVAPDMRGYNLSSAPLFPDDYSIVKLVADIKGLCDFFGQKSVVLVAHDWGGAVAWTFAMAYPEYLKRLVIINSPHPLIFDRELKSNPEQQKASEYMVALRGPKAEELISANNFAWLYESCLARSLRKGHLTTEDRDEYFKAWRRPGVLTGMVNYYRACNAGPPSKDGNPGNGNYAKALLGDHGDYRVHVPTSILWGEWDRALLQTNLRDIERYVDDLRVTLIPEATHWVTHEKPDLIVGHLREIL